jgi:hypothetical protein
MPQKEKKEIKETTLDESIKVSSASSLMLSVLNQKFSIDGLSDDDVAIIKDISDELENSLSSTTPFNRIMLKNAAIMQYLVIRELNYLSSTSEGRERNVKSITKLHEAIQKTFDKMLMTPEALAKVKKLDSGRRETLLEMLTQRTLEAAGKSAKIVKDEDDDIRVTEDGVITSSITEEDCGMESSDDIDIEREDKKEEYEEKSLRIEDIIKKDK